MSLDDMPLWLPIVVGVCGLIVAVIALAMGGAKNGHSEGNWWWLAGGLVAAILPCVCTTVLVVRLGWQPDAGSYVHKSEGPTGGKPPEPVITVIPPPKRTVEPNSPQAIADMPGKLEAIFQDITIQPKYAIPDRKVPSNLRSKTSDTEGVLELILRHEVRDRHTPRLTTAVPADEEATIAAIEKSFGMDEDGSRGLKTAIGRDESSTTYHPRAYSQWYVLLAIGMREQAADWTDEGGAVKHLNFLREQVTSQWGPAKKGVQYVDGSVIAAGFYVLLQLHANNHWANGGVGQQLGTPLGNTPQTNALRPDERRFVVLLRRCCLLFESLYGGAEIPPTVGAPYGASGVAGELNSRAGSKILYFLAKMRLAHEEMKPEAEMEKWREQSRIFFAKLEEDFDAGKTPIPNTYALAYVMRALAIFIQYESQAGDVDRVVWLGGVGKKLLAALEKGRITSEYSEYYAYLSVRQYYAQVGDALYLAGARANSPIKP